MHVQSRKQMSLRATARMKRNDGSGGHNGGLCARTALREGWGMNTAPMPAVQPGITEMLARLAVIAADAEAYLAYLRAVPGVPERRVIGLEAAVRQLGGELARADYETGLAAAWQQRESVLASRDRAPAPRRASRQRRGDRSRLRVVDDQDALPFAAALPLVPGARRALAVLRAHAAHTAAATVTTAATVTVSALGTQQFAAAPHAQPPHVQPQAAAASLIPADAVPVTLPEQSYRPRHASLDAHSSRPVKVVVQASWRPPPRPSPSPTPSPAPAGTLDVAQVQLAAGPSGSAELDFSAIGGTLTWWAWGSDGIELSASTGTLTAGQPMALTVSLAPGAVNGTVFVSTGAQVLAVPVTG